MTLPPLATVNALEIRLGIAEDSLADADLARAEAALVDVSALVRSASTRIWLDPEGNVTAPDDVLAVVYQAALRTYNNPTGLSGESIGSGAYSYTYAPGSVGTYLTAAEVAIVKYAAAHTNGARPLVGSVRTPSAYSADRELLAPYYGFGTTYGYGYENNYPEQGSPE